MTTKPESPDSGASAGDQAVAPFGYIRHDDTARGYFTSMHTQIQGFADDEFDTPLYTRAQDAAGKGVEDENESTKVTKAMGGFSLKCRQTGTAECVYAKTERIMGDPRQSFGMSCTDEVGQNAAKPAQVGQKYREPTLEDAGRLIAAKNKLKWLQDQDVPKQRLPREAVLMALKVIGAVVPAQDGGV